MDKVPIRTKNKITTNPMGYLLIFSALLFGACQDQVENLNDTTEDHQTAKMVKFSDYIQYIERLDYEKYAADHKDLQAHKLEFEKMTDHILEMYEGVEVEQSYQMEDGRTCDCIPILQQPGLRTKGQSHRLEAPPAFNPSSMPAEADPSTTDQTTTDNKPAHQPETFVLEEAPFDNHGNRRQCEEGFIPMIRLDIDRMSSFSSLDNFFHKCPNQDCFLGEENNKRNIQRRYAYLYHNTNNWGGESWLNIWKPQTPYGQNSISQQWYAAGSGNSTQTVEGGWLVFTNRTPSLFIYHTTGGYQPGTGCYNLDCQGFVQIDNHWAMGRSFNTLSRTNGSQYDFKMRWYKNGTSGPWWLWLEGYDKGTGRWIGYYPNGLYGAGPMASNATRVLFGGEVSYDNDVSSQSLQMGSGAGAAAGWSKAAYQRAVAYTTTSNQNYWMNTATLRETHPSCYTINRINTSSAAWGTYFYFGGASCN